jgi:putative transposase
MTTRDFTVGQLLQIRSKDDAGCFIVICIDKSRGLLYAHRLNSMTSTKLLGDASRKNSKNVRKNPLSAAMPVEFKLDYLWSLSEPEISTIDVISSKHTRLTLANLSAKQSDRYKLVVGRMTGTWKEIASEFAIGTDRYSKIVSRNASKHGVSRTTIARDMSRLFSCGLDAHVAGMMYIFGNVTKRSADVQRNVSKKLGRPRDCVRTGHNQENAGRNVSQKARTLIEIYIKRTSDTEKKSISTLYKKFIELFARKPSGALIDGASIMVPDLEVDMTVGQFRYHLKNIECVKVRLEKFVGRKTFKLKHRILTSHAWDMIPFPGHTYIIDSTVIDVYCVSAVDRRNLIGRPTVYVVIDAFSWVILSIYVALGSPCMEQAKVALYHALTDKLSLIEGLGIRGCRSGMVKGVVPLTLFSDRGELLSYEGAALAETMQISQSISAPYRADWKCLVERYFGIQNTEVIHWVPGAVRKRMAERGDRDVRLDAVLTVHDLQRILLNLAAEWNLTHDMSKSISCQMLRKNIYATPTSFWNHGLEEMHGSPSYLTHEDAVRQLLPLAKARADRQGVHVLANLRFTAPWMAEDSDYFQLISQSNSPKVYLNPDRPLGAYLLGEDNNLQDIDLVDMRGYKDLDVSRFDLEDHEEYMSLLATDNEEYVKVVHSTLARERDAILESASAQTKEAAKSDGRSKTKRTAAIRDGMRIEIASEIGQPKDVDPIPEAPKSRDAALNSMRKKYCGSN